MVNSNNTTKKVRLLCGISIIKNLKKHVYFHDDRQIYFKDLWTPFLDVLGLSG